MHDCRCVGPSAASDRANIANDQRSRIDGQHKHTGTRHEIVFRVRRMRVSLSHLHHCKYWSTYVRRSPSTIPKTSLRSHKWMATSRFREHNKMLFSFVVGYVTASKFADLTHNGFPSRKCLGSYRATIYFKRCERSAAINRHELTCTSRRFCQNQQHVNDVRCPFAIVHFTRSYGPTAASRRRVKIYDQLNYRIPIVRDNLVFIFLISFFYRFLLSLAS